MFKTKKENQIKSQ